MGQRDAPCDVTAAVPCFREPRAHGSASEPAKAKPALLRLDLNRDRAETLPRCAPPKAACSGTHSVTINKFLMVTLRGARRHSLRRRITGPNRVPHRPRAKRPNQTDRAYVGSLHASVGSLHVSVGSLHVSVGSLHLAYDRQTPSVHGLGRAGFTHPATPAERKRTARSVLRRGCKP